MLNGLKTVAACTAALFIAGCGGGGGDGTAGSGSGGDTGSTTTNPLAKYAGTYYVCDNENSKQTVTVAALGADGATLNYVEDTYQNRNCTGAIVGTFRLPQPLTITFQSQTTANFPRVTVLPTADTVDRVTISAPAMTAQLTGSGVSGLCVKYPNGENCYDGLSNPAYTETGAVHLTGNYLTIFSLVNSVLEADGVYSKDASFNINMLIPD